MLSEMRFRLLWNWNRVAAMAMAAVLFSAAPAGCGDVGAPLTMESNPMAYMEHYFSAGPEEKQRINQASAHTIHSTPRI